MSIRLGLVKLQIPTGRASPVTDIMPYCSFYLQTSGAINIADYKVYSYGRRIFTPSKDKLSLSEDQ